VWHVPVMARELEVVVYYDFASTLCYVAHRVMERIADDLDAIDVALCWRPIDLTRLTGWYVGMPLEGVRRANALRVALELDVSVRMPAAWPDSRSAGAVSLGLAGSDLEAAWRERVFSAVHEQGRSLDDPALLPALGRDLGLGTAGLADATALAALDAETERAREAEVSGVPTLLLGGWPIGGIQEAWVMRSLLERWAMRRRAARAPEPSA